MKLIAVVGARPNFMKVAPILRALEGQDSVRPLLCHTGQHYDERMSQVFFEELRLPRPDLYLEVGSGTHATQTAAVMTAFEKVLLEESPDRILVVGDVNSTLACSLVAAKLHVPVAHVEAGLRSFDRRMPEEINRMLTDVLADLLFTTTVDAEGNLLAEGADPEKIHFVGNVMIDSLLYYGEDIDRSGVLGALGLKPGGYALMTMHRPSNVDDPAALAGLLEAVAVAGKRMPLVWPLHPRTRGRVEDFGIDLEKLGILPVPPQGYFDFQSLQKNARLVITDSGGIQEETTVLGVPCLTVRENTERPVTCEMGTNRLVGTHPEAVRAAVAEALAEPPGPGRVPPLWDGRAAERIAAILQA